MRRLLAMSVTALILATACATDDPAAPAPSPTASVSPTPTASPSPEALTLTPGAFGPVRVGMSQDEAAATGLFDVDVVNEDDFCEAVTPLRWKEPYLGTIDVLTGEDGTIVSMGVLNDPAISTSEGISVGSTFAEVRDAYPTLSAAEEAGFNQTGTWLEEDGAWLGFLFDNTLDEHADDSAVIFMEVGLGERPPLIRSGC